MQIMNIFFSRIKRYVVLKTGGRHFFHREKCQFRTDGGIPRNFSVSQNSHAAVPLHGYHFKRADFPTRKKRTEVRFLILKLDSPRASIAVRHSATQLAVDRYDHVHPFVEQQCVSRLFAESTHLCSRDNVS